MAAARSIVIPTMQGLVAAALAAVLLLLPIQFLVLPFNLALSDVVAAAALPLTWGWLWRARLPLRAPYLAVMLLILLATGVASIRSGDPVLGITTLATDCYLFLWFFTFAAAFEHLDQGLVRRLLAVWCVAVFANGAVILAQFAQPGLLGEMNRSLAGIGALDPFRPSGLLANCNVAAVFQLAGFVPLLLLRLRLPWLLLLGMLNLAALLGTGSMGAVLALGCGLAAAPLVAMVLHRDARPVLRFLVVAGIAAGVLALAAAVLAHYVPGVQDRFESIFHGREERSAATRFGIWARGTEVLLGDLPLWGIGPGMFKRTEGTEMHNDLLAFAVERGLVAALGLLALVGMMMTRAALAGRAWAARGEGVAMVFLPAIVALVVEAQTHEVFHLREAWTVLALLEAMYWLGRPAPPMQPVPPQD